MNTLLETAGSLIGLIGGSTILTIGLAFASDRKAQYERVSELIELISSAEIAEARQIVGTYINAESTRTDKKQTNRSTPINVLNSYFTILWCFQRIYAVRESLTGIPGMSGPRDTLDKMISPWITYWAENSSIFDNLEDEHSRNGLDMLMRELKISKSGLAKNKELNNLDSRKNAS